MSAPLKELKFFPHAEGYVNVEEGKFNYVYNYTDHLGNVPPAPARIPSCGSSKKHLSLNIEMLKIMTFSVLKKRIFIIAK